MTSFSTTIAAGFVIMAVFWMPFALAADVQLVELGSTVILGCNISYLFDTTWLKQNPDLTPSVVLCGSLREGQPIQVCQLSPRFSLTVTNRSLALKITGVEETDLGLYYCVANVNTHFTVGSGAMLQVSSAGSSWFLVHHWYCVVAFCLLIMVLAVCITHWKVKLNKRTTKRTLRTHRTQRNKTTSNN